MFSFSPIDLVNFRVFDCTPLTTLDYDSFQKIAYPMMKECEILAFFEIENMQFYLCRLVTEIRGTLPNLEMHYIKGIKKLTSGEYLESVIKISMEDVQESDFAQIPQFES